MTHHPTEHGVLLWIPNKQICPKCGKVHTGNHIIVNSEKGKKLWESCLDCWGEMIKCTPNRLEFAQQLSDCLTLLTTYRDRCAELVAIGLRGLPATEEVNAVIERLRSGGVAFGAPGVANKGSVGEPQ